MKLSTTMGKGKSGEEKMKSRKMTTEDESGRFDTSKPQFRKPKKESTKVVLDERFSSVLTDPRFQLEAKDKHGRPSKSKKASRTEALSEFYTIEKPTGAEKERRDNDSHSSSTSNASSDEGDARTGEQGQPEEDETPASRIAYLTALSRGQLDISSSSSSEDDSDQENSDESDSYSDDDDDQSVGEAVAGILDPSSKEEEVELTTDKSPYLAVLNMDWSHVRAVDIFAILSSFVQHGQLESVHVYPSDFGLEKMKKEEIFGPEGVWQDQKSSSDVLKDDDKVADELDRGDEETVPSESEEGSLLPTEDQVVSGFEPEKLRAYEVSKLKYYFAVAEFASPESADVAYKEVDGFEFEHSSTPMDLRVIPSHELESVVKDRTCRDGTKSLPSNYVPPEFIVAALQQTSVKCTWEMGDHERERTLTMYTSGESWRSLAESDDLRAYLASEGSSDEGENSEDEKVVSKRKMLGLDSNEDDVGKHDAESGDRAVVPPEDSSSSDSEDGERKNKGKETTFVPGQKVSLEKAIRSNLKPKENPQELTPWEKYKEKRRQKRRERRQAARRLRKDVTSSRNEETNASRAVEKQSREDLALLTAGDDLDEAARDFDMRGLERLDQNKDKKLRGSRKRKETELAKGVAGKDFRVNTGDDRFKALLDGEDSRFGIDRTDPSYKETAAMRDILSEQSRRRSKKKRKKQGSKQVVPDISAESETPSSGANVLSALVRSIKTKVNQ